MRTILLCAAVLPFAAACSSDSSCKTARDCAASQRCVNFACTAPTAGSGKVGDSCAASGDCTAGLTCDATGFPSGMCTQDCTSAACSSGACAGLSTGPTCAATCASDADCRNGYACCADLGNVCLPSAACVSPTCKRPVAVTSLTGAQVLIKNEQHVVGDMVNFAVPAGTASITIVQQAQLANLSVVYKGQEISNAAVPGAIYKPDNSKAYDDNDPAFSPGPSPDGGTDPSGVYSYYGGETPVTGAFTFPNTAASLDAGVPSGNWKFQVNDYAFECTQGIGCSDGGSATNSYDVTVIAKPAPTHTLDLAFWIVGDETTTTGQPFVAATAAQDPSVKRMLSTFKSIYAGGGITIGNVAFYDATASDKARFGTTINADTTGPCDELAQMFTMSSAHPENVLNLYLVQKITSKNQGGGSVVGIDGTIPGPASFAGTIASGAAVSMANLFAGAANCIGTPDLSCGADEVAFIAAHEAGHFLGLFHLTESDGRNFDPLTDTAKCPCISCASSTDLPNCSTGGSASSPIFLVATRCHTSTCGGGDNLMFWQLSATVSQGNLTPQQGAVMALNPVVH